MNAKDINISNKSKLITFLANQAGNKAVSEADINEADEIVMTLAEDFTPENRHKIAQIVGYTIERMQQGSLDFLNQVADQKNIGYGDKAAFNVKTGGVKAYFQAKGSTTPRSMVTGKQILVDTEEVSARPAINIMDIRTNRVKMADLIREANLEITNKKLAKVEQVLHAAVSKLSSPFYATGSGIVAETLDKQLAYWRRLGPVTILGDIEAVAQMSTLNGMKLTETMTQHSDSQINEMDQNGYIGRYKGCNVVAMTNAYYEGETAKPILDPNWLYIIPGNVATDSRNLKLVNEGGISSFEAQDINDLTFEIRLDQWFGAAFVTGRTPTIGAYKIGG